MNKKQDNMEGFPEILSPIVKSDYPNEEIVLTHGDFILKWKGKSFKLKGRISFKWLPTLSVIFFGSFELSNDEIPIDRFETDLNVEIQSNMLDFKGRGFIQRFVQTRKEPTISIYLTTPIELGDKSINVESIKFEVPNLITFRGLPIRDGTKGYRGRLILEDDIYKITLDNIEHDLRLVSIYNREGGFMVNYTGLLEKITKKGISFTEANEVLECFSKFLHFVNGRRTAALFRHGLYNKKIIWKDYSPFMVDNQKDVIRWPSEDSIDGLSQLWKNFRKLWKQKSDKDCISSVLHWYIEANNNSALVEGSITLIQTALELLFHWQIVEKKKYVISNEADGLSASTKIGFLLATFSIDASIPSELSGLIAYAKKSSISNGPEAFVRIRNCIVHPDKDKRRTLSNVDKIARYEVLHLGIWYVEIILLKVLEYKGIYVNRCKRIGGSRKVKEYIE